MTGNPSAATRSALVVAVPEAEPVVGRHRRALARSATVGVPAHVTVLYPFLAPERVDDAVLDKVREALSGTTVFECVFSRVRWFGEHLVWLQPEPDAPFRALTAAVWHRFPDHPPYGGDYSDPSPHLTVGDAHTADPTVLRRAAVDIEPELPITARIDRVLLLAGSDEPDSWWTMAVFDLPAGSPAPGRPVAEVEPRRPD
ncbi:MAG: 2'-5' RNA ligase family protein [Sciscionella sp.]